MVQDLSGTWRLDGIPCLVHLLQATRVMQADDVCVPCDELVGPTWGTYKLPGSEECNVAAGTTVGIRDYETGFTHSYTGLSASCTSFNRS